MATAVNPVTELMASLNAQNSSNMARVLALYPRLTLTTRLSELGGKSAIRYMVENRMNKLIRYVIDNKIPLNLETEEDLVEIVVQHADDAGNEDNYSSEDEYYDIAVDLVKRGAPIRDQKKKEIIDRILLNRVLFYSAFDSVRMLLEMGANGGIIDMYDVAGSIDIIILLLQYDINVYDKEYDVLTTLFQGIDFKKFSVEEYKAALAKLLSAIQEKNGADFIDNIGYQDKTLLMNAVLENNPIAVEFLIENGANPNIKNKYGIAAYHYLFVAPSADYKESFNIVKKTQLIRFFESIIGKSEAEMKKEADEQFLKETAIKFKEELSHDKLDKPTIKRLSKMKWVGTPSSPEKHAVDSKPIYTFIGHGLETLTKSGNEFTIRARNKILPGRILLIAAECGVELLWAIEAKKAIEYSAIDTVEKHKLFQYLYSSNINTVRKALHQIEIEIGMKLRMYREGDLYPDIEFSLDSSKKSGVYKNPLTLHKFYDTVRHKYIVPEISKYFEHSIYPTPEAFNSMFSSIMPFMTDSDKIRLKIQITTNKIFNASIGEIMERIGDGIYIFPLCRVIRNYGDLKQKIISETGKYHTNLMKGIHNYNTLFGMSANIENAKKVLSRLRAHSNNEQSIYKPHDAVTTGGSATAAATGGGSVVTYFATGGSKQNKHLTRRKTRITRKRRTSRKKC